MLHYFTYTILSLKFVQYFYLNLKSKVVSYFEEFLREKEREISDTIFLLEIASRVHNEGGEKRNG